MGDRAAAERWQGGAVQTIPQLQLAGRCEVLPSFAVERRLRVLLRRDRASQRARRPVGIRIGPVAESPQAKARESDWPEVARASLSTPDPSADAGAHRP